VVCTEQDLPALIRDADGKAAGLLVTDLTPEDRARFDFYELGFGYWLEDIRVFADDLGSDARAYRRAGDGLQDLPDWSLEQWQQRWAEVTMISAAEFMGLYGEVDAHAAARRFPTIRMRADTALRATVSPTPAAVRRGMAADEVRLVDDRRPYTGYFSLVESFIAHRRFDGGQSREVAREALLGSDAVTVLPYDPVADTVLVIEQFRFAVYKRGDARPWLLEPIAGRIDPGETPQDTGRREAREEAGLELRELLEVASYYPSPAAFTEYIYSFVDIADLTGVAGRIGGVDGEEEDILSHIVSFDALMELVRTGEADTAPLVMSALWLAAHRDEIRRRFGGGAGPTS
jgi:nudix-type nucleoside diphosphatase (YffH/AdpP family)